MLKRTPNTALEREDLQSALQAANSIEHHVQAIQETRARLHLSKLTLLEKIDIARSVLTQEQIDLLVGDALERTVSEQ